MDPLLSLKAVSMSYWRGERRVPVFDGVSLDVHRGELVTVWGQHNSGKTTLLKLAAGLAKPTQGSVSFAGRDLQDLSASGLARLLRGPIALARPTGPNSAELRMRDYVAMALLREHNHARARRLATAALARAPAGRPRSHRARAERPRQALPGGRRGAGARRGRRNAGGESGRAARAVRAERVR
jgi:ABC-type lipoprotein export system ATPase subunit